MLLCVTYIERELADGALGRDGGQRGGKGEGTREEQTAFGN